MRQSAMENHAGLEKHRKELLAKEKSKKLYMKKHNILKLSGTWWLCEIMLRRKKKTTQQQLVPRVDLVLPGVSRNRSPVAAAVHHIPLQILGETLKDNQKEGTKGRR